MPDQMKKVGIRTADHRLRELSIWLQMAVPLEMQRLANLSAEELVILAHTAVPIIPECGDVLEFGGRGAGKTASVLARSIACAALTREGGITAFGHHWCTDHNVCRRAEAVS